ncbi:hypothetical protein EUAN_12640 [Andreesenia angusta]|uniref:Uncharacterized protein n=1 Tax=Andreesenia angusta TaxID=39480 RepID=A0A1S1V705_9FIRM|nr:hypothetical protein [Andreesenia angusta]OHW62195.1 hypothetical protein EUAN_12640 [Andreesenia angusta]
MKTAIVSRKYDRSSGKQISVEVREHKDVDEKEFYKPIVEVFGKDFLEKWKKGELK